MAFNASHWNPRFINTMAKRANRLRKKQTPIEKKLRRYLQSMGIKYNFQEVIGAYIVDFLISDLDIVIEADGAYHDGQAQKDKDRLRDMDLKDKGFKVFRLKGWQIWNESICKGLLRDLLASNGSTEPTVKGFQAIDDRGGLVKRGPSLTSKESALVLNR